MAEKKKTSPKMIYESKASLYDMACKAMNADQLIVQHAFKIENYLETAEMFEQIGDYKDAAELAKKCRELAEQTKKDEVEYRYLLAVSQKELAISGKDFGKAEKLFGQVAGYKDADALKAECAAEKVRLGKKAKARRRGKLAVLLLCVAAVVCFIRSSKWDKLQKKLIEVNQTMTETAAPETDEE